MPKIPRKMHPNSHGVKGRSGPGLQNMNAIRSGTRLNLRRLIVGELPQTMIAVKREGRKYRRDLEAEVIRTKGDIDIVDAHFIDTATAGTIQAGIARWLLRNRIDERVDSAKIVHKGVNGSTVYQSAGMSTADILRCMETITKGKAIRDKAVASLNLNAPPADPWLVIDSPSVPINDETNGETDKTT